MDVIKNEGVFRLFDKHAGLIFTDEKQLDRIIQGPDTPIFVDEDLGFSAERQKLNDDNSTLASRCKEAADRGCTRMEVSYDFFFGGTTRHNYPSDETTIKAFKAVRDEAAKNGMSFGASILSPLDVGGGWAKISDETGFTYQFMETDIKPDGSYCVPMSCQVQWYNNKGPIHLIPHHVEVYAFTEERIGNTPYFCVDENAIQTISETASYEIDESDMVTTSNGYKHCSMKIFGKWANPTANRALCIMVYRTPELDYFAPSASAFMKKLLDTHNEAGIDYGGFYSDEMHIQFDWDLEEHFGDKEVNTRYLTTHLAQKYAELYGEKYKEFPKYLIYMAYHQHDFLPGAEGKVNAQHVFGKTEKDIADTWQFRNRYFELLQRTVVDLANNSKAYAEKLWGAPIMTRAHATWQESPTCDHYYKVANTIGGFNVQELLGEEYADINIKSPVADRAKLEIAKADKAAELGISRYDYTPWYDWGCSIRENISACYDYFKWNEFLCGGGTDHAEGGNYDRNYYSEALAASFGELNKYGEAYCAGWGMPHKLAKLFNRMANAYGNSPSCDELSFVNGLGTRRTDVLALYPIKLNNAEERFGSWMVQYGYCNYITEEKFLENATLTEDGKLEVNGQKFRCVVALFEPFLADKTMGMLEKFVAAGGKLLWMSVPALLNEKGEDIAPRFAKLFGLSGVCHAGEEVFRKGEAVRFGGMFAGIKDMKVPTDYIVDALWPVAIADAQPVAYVDDTLVGTAKQYAGGGLAVYMGCRLRDDQSQSLGEDVDTLFRVLCAMGAYRPGSLEVRSRETNAEYLLNTFADGSIACAPHFRKVYEAWEGKFFREEAFDAAVLEGRQLPTGHISLHEEIAGHNIDFEGEEYVGYNLDEAGAPKAMFGIGTDGITVDGVKYIFADRVAKFEFAPVPEKYLTEDVKRAILTTCWTTGATVSVPVPGSSEVKVLACRDRLFKAEDAVPFTREDGVVRYTVDEALAGKRIYIIY